MKPTLLFASLLLAGCAAPAVTTAPPPSAAPVAVVAAPAGDGMAMAPGSPLDISGPVQGAFVGYDNFESGVANWKMEGGTADVKWQLLHAHSCSGDFVMHFGRADNAPFTGQGADATLTYAKPLDVTNVKRPVLTYVVKGQTLPANDMTLQPEIRKAGGDWQPVGAVVPSLYQTGFTRRLDLSAVTGGLAELRFKLHLDAAASASPGMYLDDVGVIDVQG